MCLRKPCSIDTGEDSATNKSMSKANNDADDNYLKIVDEDNEHDVSYR